MKYKACMFIFFLFTYSLYKYTIFISTSSVTINKLDIRMAEDKSVTKIS